MFYKHQNNLLTVKFSPHKKNCFQETFSISQLVVATTLWLALYTQTSNNNSYGLNTSAKEWLIYFDSNNILPTILTASFADSKFVSLSKKRQKEVGFT